MYMDENFYGKSNDQKILLVKTFTFKKCVRVSYEKN